MRRIVTAMAVGALALAAVACGSDDEGGSGNGSGSAAGEGGGPRGKTVVNLVPALDNPFQAAYVRSFEREARRLGMTIRTQTNPFDPSLQAQQLNDAIAQKPDAINILPSNETAILPGLKRAQRAGIPVVVRTSPLKPGNESLYVTYYGPDQTKLGRLAGEQVCQALEPRGGGRVAAVTGAKIFYLVSQRMEGFRQAIGDCEQPVELVAEEDGQWDTAESEKRASQLLSKFRGQRKLDAIFAMADNQAAGVIQAAQDAGVTPGRAEDDLIVVASNCLADGVKNIRAGRQWSTNTNIPTVEGPGNARILADLFQGKDLKKNTFAPAEAVTQSNLDRFAKACDV